MSLAYFGFLGYAALQLFSIVRGRTSYVGRGPTILIAAVFIDAIALSTLFGVGLFCDWLVERLQ